MPLVLLLLACTNGAPPPADSGDPPAVDTGEGIDADGDSWTVAEGDCDDDDADVHPTATEHCGDGIDQDCDGLELGCTGSGPSTGAAGYLLGENDESFYGLGRSIDVAWDWEADGSPTVVVGAPWWDGNVESADGWNYGSVIGLRVDTLQEGHGGQGIEGREAWRIDAHAYLETHGWEVRVGDLDGDGISDLVSSTPRTGSQDDSAGVARIWWGPIRDDNVPTLEQAVSISGAVGDLRLGWDTEAGSDVTGDGVADVIVNRTGEGCGSVPDGVRVLLGGLDASRTVNDDDPSYTVEQTCWGGDLEQAVADLDGDGIGDLALGKDYGGTVLADDGSTVEELGAGIVYVVLGPLTAGGTLADADGRLEGPEPGSAFGKTVETSEDVDGDGLPDLLVGAPSLDTGEPYSGAAYVLGRDSALSRGPIGDGAHVQVVGGRNEGLYLGASLADGGDQDQDGHRELLVGGIEEGDSKEQNGRGRVYLFRGPVEGTLETDDAVASVHGNDHSDHFGAYLVGDWLAGPSLKGGIDLNGDGSDDWLAGAELRDDRGRGGIYLFYGGLWSE